MSPAHTWTFRIPDDLTERFIGVHGGSTPGVRQLGVTANDMANLMLDQLPDDWPQEPQDTPPGEHEHETATPPEDTSATEWDALVRLGRRTVQPILDALGRTLDPAPFGLPPSWTPDQTDRLMAAMRDPWPPAEERTMPRIAGWRYVWRGR